MAENRGMDRIAEIIKEVFKDLTSFSLISFSLSGSLSTSISAVKPAFTIAFNKVSSLMAPGSNSTVALFVDKFTLALTMPSILLRALSTLAEQAAQVIPSTKRTFLVVI